MTHPIRNIKKVMVKTVCKFQNSKMKHESFSGLSHRKTPLFFAPHLHYEYSSRRSDWRWWRQMNRTGTLSKEQKCVNTHFQTKFSVPRLARKISSTIYGLCVWMSTITSPNVARSIPSRKKVMAKTVAKPPFFTIFARLPPSLTFLTETFTPGRECV